MDQRMSPLTSVKGMKGRGDYIRKLRQLKGDS